MTINKVVIKAFELRRFLRKDRYEQIIDNDTYLCKPRRDCYRHRKRYAANFCRRSRSIFFSGNWYGRDSEIVLLNGIFCDCVRTVYR